MVTRRFGPGRLRVVAVLGVLLAGRGAARAEAPPLAGSQISLETGQVAFQGSVIDRRDDPPRLTVVTAAHGLFPLGRGTPIAVRPVAAAVVLQGTVESAVPNPGYKPVRSRDPRSPTRFQGAIGSDSSVVTIRLTPEGEAQRRAFLGLTTVPVAPRPVLDRARGGVLTVHVVDRGGVEHVVRAGNSMNPKWLAWGPAYRPRPGDSGAGVFVVSETPGGPPRVLLIGNVVASDDAGGIAALFSRAEFPALAPAGEPDTGKAAR